MFSRLHERKLLEMLPEPTLLVAKDGRLIVANQAARQLLRSSSADLRGKDISELIIESTEQLQLYLRDCSRTSQFHIARFTFRTGTGDKIPCRCGGARLVLSDGTEALLLRQTPTNASNPFVQLTDQIHALNRSRHELEKKVRARTADLLKARNSLRDLSARLMTAQDEERRRLAHQLHDSTGQVLTGIQLNLGALLSEGLFLPDGEVRVARIIELANQAIAEIRALSEVLHPPLLDEAGLLIALRTFVDSFQKRCNVAVTIDVPEAFGRIAPELETGIFRVVQECLTNVHHHSASERAEVSLVLEDDTLHLEVRDAGRGIVAARYVNASTASKEGVGLRGMKERVRLLGGSIELLDANPGTIVKVLLPMTAPPREPLERD